PLHGKTFYLDLPGGRDERELAAAIGRLGGVTESFLSKEVSYVVSSNKEAKQDKSRTFTKRQSNVSSECARATGPMPSTSKGTHTRPHQKPPDTVLISRGKELLQKAMKNQVSSVWMGFFSILANARLWGVQILHVDGILRRGLGVSEAGGAQVMQNAVVRSTAAACRVGSRDPLPEDRGRLKPPFLKVEDQSRQFRPFHHQFKVFPELNFLAPKGSSPFEPLKSLSNSHRTSGGEKSPQSTPVTVPKKRRKGFCECCQETFEELHKHLQSPQHQRFALDNSQYSPVDQVISQLTSSF
ncbi:DBF4B protein, partial [Rhinopomastus cyanomelas]|nr:DBF4B protein [Rhinopomastus cyanomelas]